MKVELLYHTPLIVVVKAIRRCHKSEHRMDTEDDNIGERDKKLVQNIIKLGHVSTIEHLCYTFDIQGISRGCLQELVRHRIASYSVKSTRYTLHHLIKDERFAKKELTHSEIVEIFNDYFVSYKSAQPRKLVNQLKEIRRAIKDGMKNDDAKYMLPESFKTELIWTINARSLRNFLGLRTHPAAHWEIRKLAYEVYKNIPESHKFIFEDVVHE